VTDCSGDLLFKRYFGETFDEMSPSRREEIAKLLAKRLEDIRKKRVQGESGKP
jgi:hypothetical protein